MTEDEEFINGRILEPGTDIPDEAITVDLGPGREKGRSERSDKKYFSDFSDEEVAQVAREARLKTHYSDGGENLDYDTLESVVAGYESAQALAGSLNYDEH